MNKPQLHKTTQNYRIAATRNGPEMMMFPEHFAPFNSLTSCPGSLF